MTMLHVLPVLVYLGAVFTVLCVATARRPVRWPSWPVPAVLGAAFAVFSAATVAREGLLPFWRNHTTNWAGNQVWFDLAGAVTVAFVLIAPRARAVGMRLMPWGVAVIGTACIALLPMLARVLWLEARAAEARATGGEGAGTASSAGTG